MYFGDASGSLESAVRTTSSITEAIRDFNNVPGSLLTAAARWSDPVAFGWEPWLDWMQSQASPDALRLFARVNRWTLDELPMPKRLFEEVAGALYRDNRFAQRALRVGKRLADPKALDAPILAVADPRSRVVPPASMQAYRTCTGSTDVDVLEYGGDAGVMLQHVGVLVGPNAHERLWPRILAWVHRHAVDA